MRKEIFEIAKRYGDSCSNCKEICCINMMLDIDRDDIRKISKYLKMKPEDFRKKYTMLLSNLMKKYEYDALSQSGKNQINRNKRVLVFDDDHDIDEDIIGEEQKKRLLDSHDSKFEIAISICPFFDAKNHKCSIHTVRPGSCYTYPFEYADEEHIDLRKVNVCVLSTNFLKRFNEFLKRNIKSKTTDIDKILESKEYYNHLHIHALTVFTYIFVECKKFNIPITSDEIKYIEMKLKKEVNK